MVGIILTQHKKVRDLIDTFKMLGTKLIHGAKIKDQTYNLPLI